MKLLLVLTFILITLGVIFKTRVPSTNKPSKNTPSPIGYGYTNPNFIKNSKGEISNFSLLDQNGNYHELYRYSDKKAIVIISSKLACQLPATFFKNINSLASDFSHENIAFFFMNSNINESRIDIAKNSIKKAITIPTLLDSSGAIAHLFQLKSQNELVIISPQGWRKIYHGFYDNNLKDILHDLSIDKNIQAKQSPPQTKETCAITFQNNEKISFDKDVAPILINKCLSCHSNEGHFPPYFTSIEKFKNWSQMSKETILTDRMPPGSADSFYGDYHDNFTLTKEEKSKLLFWLINGMPTTKNNDPIQNFLKTKNYSKKNELKPIYTATMNQAMPIAPGGQMEYGYVQLGGQVPYDMWVTGVKVKSTNPRQIHHEAMMITSQPLSLYEKVGKEKFKINQEKIDKNIDGDIVLYTLRAMRQIELKKSPGTYFRSQVWGAGKPQPFFWGHNNAAFIPKGYYIILENHYMGTGRNETEQTTIEFFGHLKKESFINRLNSFTLTTNDFEIPAKAKNYLVTTPSWKVNSDIKFTNFLPHLHMRGSSVKLNLIEPDGKKKIIYSAPNFNYGWQTGFLINLINPIPVKKNSIVQAECTFDNSPENPFNPDPHKTIRFGQRLDRTEMCKINTNFTIEDKKVNSSDVFELVDQNLRKQIKYED
jgi:hypothetical protein